ncbi:MAG: acyltransferase [Clostridia bacterium]|nr:acyltransferase [Clostridia bacterium]
MLTYIIMLLLCFFLAFLVLYRDRKGKSSDFFDIEATGTMRGFWCIIVLLVHVPAVYQNTLQDALGSFAYIAVSFFFMTSGYGLMLSIQKNAETIRRGFWRRRLSKLLLPMLFVNIFRVVTVLIVSGTFQWTGFFHINGFVKELLALYLLFWIVFRFLPKTLSLNAKRWILCGAVALLSVGIYLWKDNPLFGWSVEAFGFIYGVLLAGAKDKVEAFAKRHWILKSGVLTVISLVLGVGYLKFKAIPIVGDYILRVFLGAALLGLTVFLNAKFPLGNPIGRFLGRVSYEVYLLQDVVFYIGMAIPFVFDSGVFILLCLVLTVLISTLINVLAGLIHVFLKGTKR